MDYDYKKKRLGKIPDEEVKQAVEKFEESKELAERSMFNFLENDVSLSFVFVYCSISRWEMHVGLDEAHLILYRRQGLKQRISPCVGEELCAQRHMGELKNSAGQTRLTQRFHVSLLSMSSELSANRMQGDEWEEEWGLTRLQSCCLKQEQEICNLH